MKLLSLSIPDAQGNPTRISAPSGIPTGGLEAGGAGQRLITVAIEILFVASIILTLFFLISAGFTWMTSEGDKTAIQSARAKLIYAIVGLIIVFMSFFIIRIIGGFFGVDLLYTPLLAPSCTAGQNC